MATTPPANPQYPVQPQMGVPPPPPKKKMGALGWILIGCGGLIVIIVVVVLAGGLFIMHKAKQAGIDPDLLRTNPGLAAAKMVVAANPDLELISEDDERGIIRVHDKKQNKNFIVNFEDAKKGKLTLQEEGQAPVTITSSGNGQTGSFEAKSADGSLTIGGAGAVNLPSWMPPYPSSQPQGTFSSEDAQGKRSQFTFKTSDPVDKVASFYKDALTSNGLKISNSTMSEANGHIGAMVIAQDDATNREAVIAVGKDTGDTTVTVTWTEKK
jgi:hypothetical protein